jgi:hypothetical protein
MGANRRSMLPAFGVYQETTRPIAVTGAAKPKKILPEQMDRSVELFQDDGFGLTHLHSPS